MMIFKLFLFCASIHEFIKREKKVFLLNFYEPEIKIDKKNLRKIYLVIADHNVQDVIRNIYLVIADHRSRCPPLSLLE